jgi:tetratricopeptide (TPR) repeat protein
MFASIHSISNLSASILPAVTDYTLRPDPKFRKARKLFDEALRLHLAGHIEDAAALYEQSLFLDPDFADTHNNLGAILASQCRFDEAIARYNRALFLKPDWAEAHSNLGTALAAKGRLAESIPHYQRAIALNPEHAGTHYNLGIALAALGKNDEAVTHYRRAALLKPDYADAHNNLGNALAALGDCDSAVVHYRRAILANPYHFEAHNNLGNILREEGLFDDAMAHYRRAIAINPASTEAHYHRAEIKTFRLGDADLAALEGLAARSDLPADKAPFIHFALAKALEDIGDYARAFEHLRKGNDLKRSRIVYDEAAIARNFERIAAVFDRNLLDRMQGHGDPSAVPVFVVGMPRSGSTLVEQILASHPQIHGAGELENLARVSSLNEVSPRRIGEAYLAALPPMEDGKLRVVDKLPGNFLRIGLIRLILPNAKIIHTVRDPIDTCVSCYSKLFASGQHFSYEMGELGRYYRLYAALMDHWRSVLPPGAMLDVAYEDIVDDLEGQARRLIEYCGLPWDDRCVGFHRTRRPVRTASAVQVRKPLFRSSLRRWRRFEAGLSPLLRELAAEDLHHVRSADARQFGAEFAVRPDL